MPYELRGTIRSLGGSIANAFFEKISLLPKKYFKDDINGLNKTFLFEIPKMKITSNLDIVMGEKASPTISVFNIIGLPIRENNQWVVSRMYLLSDDIDNDI